MEYKTITNKKYNLHMIKTDKFKSINIYFIFYNSFKKVDITKRKVLSNLLLYSTKKYNTERKLEIKYQDLYSSYCEVMDMRIGNYLVTKYNIALLNPKYTEENMLEENLKLINEIFNNPNIENNHFDKKTLDIIKKRLLGEHNKIFEYSDQYSKIKLLENMSKTDNYRYSGYCDMNVLNQIDEKNIYEYYLDFFKENNLDIIVVGDISYSNMEKMIDKNININTSKHTLENVYIKHERIRKNYKNIIEKGIYKQSNLEVGCKIKEVTDIEKMIIANLYTKILSNSDDSLLMRNIREKKSLVYYIFSNYIKGDNLLIINSSIDYRNRLKVIKEIKKGMNDIKNGNFDDDLFNKCKIEFINGLISAYEIPLPMSILILRKILLNLPVFELEENKDIVEKITKQDIINFANKVCLDTIYVLEGDNGYDRI